MLAIVVRAPAARAEALLVLLVEAASSLAVAGGQPRAPVGVGAGRWLDGRKMPSLLSR